MLFSVIIVVCLTHQFVIAQQSRPVPTGKLEPEENHVLEGSVAEFTCTVSGRVKQDTNIYWQYVYEYKLIWEYSPTSMTQTYVFDNDYRILETLMFSNDTVVYNSNYEEEVFMLSIRNVRPTNDSSIGLIFCIYGDHTNEIGKLLLDTSQLVVWRKPSRDPQCKFEGHIPEIITVKDGHYSIKLTCSLDDGNPKPELIWYVASKYSGLDIIGSPGVDSISADRDITAADHGIEYICHAVIGAIADEPLTCSIIPYNPAPKISITMITTEEYDEEDIVMVFCNNTGFSTPDTTYLWYINGMMLSTTLTPDDGTFLIKQTLTNSTLFISNFLLSSNSAEITCEGVIPMTARANGSLTITIDTIDDRTDSESIKIIAAAVAGGSFVMIIVVLLICCVIKRIKSNKASNGEEQDETTTEGAMSMVQSATLCHLVSLIFSKSNVTQDKSEKY